MSKNVKRQFPNPIKLAQLLRFRGPSLNRKQARLNRAMTIWDLREIAKKRTALKRAAKRDVLVISSVSGRGVHDVLNQLLHIIRPPDPEKDAESDPTAPRAWTPRSRRTSGPRARA